MKPFIKEFDFSGMKITSVVLDADEFAAFCNELEGIFDLKSSQKADKNSIDSIRNAGHLPLMARGTKTAKFFERWNVKTDKMGVVRRGLFSQMMAGGVDDA